MFCFRNWHEHFPDFPEIVRIVLKITITSGYLPEFLKIFQPVLKSSIWSGNLPYCPEIFQTVWKFSWLSINLTNYPTYFSCKNFQDLQKLSRQQCYLAINLFLSLSLNYTIHYILHTKHYTLHSITYTLSIKH